MEILNAFAPSDCYGHCWEHCWLLCWVSQIALESSCTQVSWTYVYEPTP
jgi:hypothetical protein